MQSIHSIYSLIYVRTQRPGEIQFECAEVDQIDVVVVVVVHDAAARCGRVYARTGEAEFKPEQIEVVDIAVGIGVASGERSVR